MAANTKTAAAADALDAIERRATELELRLGQLESELRDTAKDLREEVRWVRRRLAMFYPERTHCPKCHKLVSSAARSCSCGERWGKDPDPKAGLPR